MQCNHTALPLGRYIVTIKADSTQFLHAEKPILFSHSSYLWEITEGTVLNPTGKEYPEIQFTPR